MARLGLAARLALIIAAGLVAMQMLMSAAYFFDRRPTTGGALNGPMIEQMVALVALLDTVPPEQRALVLRAATVPGFSTDITPNAVPPAPDADVLAFVEKRLRAQISDPSRAISARVEAEWQVPRLLRPLLLQWRAPHLRVEVELAHGGYLQVDATGELIARLFGIPVGLLAGLLGLGVAFASVWAVRRETRPLSHLSQAVERFGARLEPQPVTPRGAPDVRSLIVTFDDMQNRIVELVRNRSLVLGALSHDLKTYVTRLRLRLELLPDDPQKARAQGDLEEMQTLLDDALAFARGTFAAPGGAPVDLAKIVGEECAARQAVGAQVAMTPPAGPCLVSGAAPALKRVAANLIGNAIAYGGSAEVRVTIEGDQVALVVEDRGPGIPEAERTRVFEPFYRMEASRSRATGGAGLGLTIVKQIVESLGGAVSIAERPGGGARLTVRLPHVRAAE
ncbi:two-component sensor histidine kinase [Azorhizobium oxalatiphilum]|uniref:histidine kinase n=1 Tax=Azorhizobium oxalatiphilum TaxID=980631 RepID=A0A917C7P7_9HYPH|nr:HAMP domain-containing sensor histidine kinase [Azorhizobium oxalatiphilum]GGF75046.1 two-component sensor histidine kinase [Azorhizobium oxalatiphilum]